MNVNRFSIPIVPTVDQPAPAVFVETQAAKFRQVGASAAVASSPC